MAWGKRNFVELDGRIKPHSLTNGSSKQTVASNENCSFYVWQMKNVHGFTKTVNYHVLLLLTKQLQDIIPENSPVSGRVEIECPSAGLIFCCLDSSDFFGRLSSALLLTSFGGQLSKLFATCNESCAKRF